MQILVLSARPDLATNRRFEEAAESAGLDLEVVDATVVCAVAGLRSGLRCGDQELLTGSPGAVLARVGNWRPESLLAALEIATAAGVPTPNSAPSTRLGRDHWQTIERLGSVGLPVPPTVTGAEPESLARAAVEELGLPVVVKQRRARMGVGVILCRQRDHLEAVVDSLWRVGDEVLVQAYVDCGGTSRRLLVVGDRVVAAAELRAADGEWRSNAARGGTACGWQPSAGEVRLGLAAAAAVGLGVCGVDLLPSADGAVVVEVNPTPGFRRLEAVSGVDVAAAIVRHLAELAGGSPPGL